MYLAKEAITRPVGTRNADPIVAELEDELYGLLNETGIGPMGLGGELVLGLGGIDLIASAAIMPAPLCIVGPCDDRDKLAFGGGVQARVFETRDVQFGARVRGDWAVDNNVWLLGDDHQVIVIDAAHDPQAILRAVGERRLSAIVCTHGHNDHINAAPQVADAKGAPVLLHPADQVLWQMIYPGQLPDGDLADEEVMEIAATPLRVLHTPGHSPGSIALWEPATRMLISGDAMYDNEPISDQSPGSSIPTYIKTMERFKTIPARIIHGGHRLSFDAERMIVICDEYLLTRKVGKPQ